MEKDNHPSNGPDKNDRKSDKIQQQTSFNLSEFLKSINLDISREGLEKLFAEVKRTKYYLQFYDLLNYIKQAEKNGIETSDIEDEIPQLRKECIERGLNICRISLIRVCLKSPIMLFMLCG